MKNKRRRLLRALAITGGSATVAQVPLHWTRPVVESVALPAHAQTTTAGCEEAGGDNPTSFDAPGSFSFIVPAGVTVLTVELVGADGGGADFEASSGGEGATVQVAALPVTPCETLTVCVGEAGGMAPEGDGGTAGASTCGYGGGAGGSGDIDSFAGGGGGGGGGGLQGGSGGAEGAEDVSGDPGFGGSCLAPGGAAVTPGTTAGGSGDDGRVEISWA